MFTCNNCGGTISDEGAIDSHVATDTRIMYLLYLEQADTGWYPNLDMSTFDHIAY